MFHPALFALSHYAALAGLALLSYGLGRRITGRCEYASFAAQVAASTGLGLGALALILFILGMAGALHATVVGVTLALIAAGCAGVWKALWTKVLGTPRRVRLQLLLSAAAVVLLLLPLLVLPLYPPTAFDATMYHLPYAKHYVESHAVRPVLSARYPVFPQVNEMLFTLALLVFDDVLAQMIQVLMMVLICLALYAWGSTRYSREAGLLAAGLWLANPLALRVAGYAYVDIGITLFATLGACALFGGLSKHRLHGIVLAGAFAGLAAGSKYSGLFFVAALGVSVLWLAVKERNTRYVVGFATAALATGAPWYLYNAYHSGNPIFPFLAGLFPNRYWSTADTDLFHSTISTYGTGRSFGALIRLPWSVPFGDFPEKGQISPIFFAALPALWLYAAFRTHTRALVLLSTAYIVFWFATAPVMRYVLAILPVMSVAIAVMLDGTLLKLIRPSVKWRIVVAGGLALVFAFAGLRPTAAAVHDAGVPPSTREARNRYLERHITSFRTLQFLNDLKHSGYTLYAMHGEDMRYFADGRVMGDWFGPARFSLIQSKFGDGQALYTELRQLKADYFLVRLDRVTAPLPDDEFFRSHFKFVYAEPSIQLFELTEQPVSITRGSELLENPGFEESNGTWPDRWISIGAPVADRSGNRSWAGRAAVRASSGDAVSQRAAIGAAGPHALSIYARSEGEDANAWLQLNWHDRANNLLQSHVETIAIGRAWKQHRVLSIAPPAAAAVSFFAIPRQGGSVWIDETSLVSLRYGSAVGQPVPGRQTTAAITASPNPVPSGTSTARTTITWTTGDRVQGQVYLYVPEKGGPEQLFAQGAAGSQDAPWIGEGGTYEFRLYAGLDRQTRLGTVQVRMSPRAGSSPVSRVQSTSAPGRISAGYSPFGTVVTWDSGDASWSQVYSTIDGGPETLLAEGPVGLQEVPSNGSARRSFRLYAGRDHAKPLAAVDAPSEPLRRRAPAWIPLAVLVLVAAALIAAVVYRSTPAGPSVAVILALTYFVAAATRNIDMPGLYYDEALFVNAALGGINDAFVYKRIFGVPFMIGNYMGALKPYVYYPIFLVAGVSPETIRIPVILISAAAIWLSFLVARAVVGRWPAALLAALLATDPAFVFHARLDWGPAVLMIFFKVLALYFFYRLITAPSAWSVAGLAAAMILGLYDKFNFIWFVVAFTIAAVAIYPKEVRDVARRYWKYLVPAVVGLVVVAGLLLRLVIGDVARIGQVLASASVLRQRAALAGSIVRSTLDGTVMYTHVTGDAFRAATLVAPVLGICLVLFVGLIVSLAVARRWPGTAVRAGAFFLVLWGLIFVQIVLTPQAATGPHILMLYPFHHFFVVAVAVATLRAAARWRTISRLCVGVLFAALIVSQHRAVDAHLEAFRPQGQFSTIWSPRIYTLAASLDQLAPGVDRVMIADWGIYNQVFALGSTPIRHKSDDVWRAFDRLDPANHGQTTQLASYFQGNDVAVVLHGPKGQIFSKARANFLAFSSQFLNPPTTILRIPAHRGEPVFEIYVYKHRQPTS